MAALDLLPEVKPPFTIIDNYPYSIMMLVNSLEGYPFGVCLLPNEIKTAIHCADSLISAFLAVLWQGEVETADIETIENLLESALDSICSTVDSIQYERHM
ncbi:hypothetical protein [Dyadobacter chenhuakuii]|uniref:Uncharacterized protein n=1 Tax=Dyadobacter chenhuakuii TaxID=2909339 RepID=A0ABY4XIH2_9BACT|nr:hypothetical protein [Dyadobacter chenhuakuii]MCF2495776.1 hypothetical protein [Dyadobacter chenhuakuii]USJ29807.1 hypothetical protein NFI80_18220 [Dyadobacter chenhuakuii]